MLRRLAPPTIGALVLPLVAGAWSYDLERGLDLYRTPPAPTVVSLVCDPEGVYGGDESAVLVELNGFRDYSGPLTFHFPDDAAIKTTMVHGWIGKRDLEPDAWASILKGLSLHNTLSVEKKNGQVYRVVAGKRIVFSCL